LILVSYLADDGYECLFGVKQCLVKFVWVFSDKTNFICCLCMMMRMYTMRMCVRLESPLIYKCKKKAKENW
jgi:hypothetical protein